MWKAVPIPNQDALKYLEIQPNTPLVWAGQPVKFQPFIAAALAEAHNAELATVETRIRELERAARVPAAK